MASEKRIAWHRRRFLASLGIGTGAALSGCLGDGDGDDGDDGDNSGDSDSDTDDDSMDDGDDGDDSEPSDDGDDGEDFPSIEGSYDVAHHAQFTTLNPIYNSESHAGTAISRTLHQGYTFNQDGEVFPLIYEDISDEGGTVWTITIRDNLQFSDPYGQVTAEDFVYLIHEVHQSDTFPSANSTNWQGVEVEQTGEMEFQAEIANPDPIWPRTFDPLAYPIPKDLIEPYVQEEDVEGMEQDEELIDLTFTGNLGPYVLDNWERGSGTQYSRNEDFYLRDIDEGPELFAQAPYFEEASFQLIEEQSSRIGALQTGQVTTAALPPERVEEFENDDAFDVYSIPTPFNNIFHFNMRDNGWNGGPGNLFRQKAFRQAMACAVDKQGEINGIYFGRAEPHFTWQPQWSVFYPDNDDEVPKFGWGDMYGEEVAKGKVEEALEGFEHDYYYDDSGMLNTPEDEVVQLEFLHSDTSQTVRNRAEFYASELSENLGIEVEVGTVEGTYFVNNMWTGEPEGGTDMVNGEEVEWDAPNPNNPGPRSVTSNDPWDLALVFGLNTYARHPLANEVFFDGADAFYNPTGWYPEGWDPQAVFEDMRQAETEEELHAPLETLFIELAYEQPGQVMVSFTDDIEAFEAGLQGPIENFNNGWDFPAWHFE